MADLRVYDCGCIEDCTCERASRAAATTGDPAWWLEDAARKAETWAEARDIRGARTLANTLRDFAKALRGQAASLREQRRAPAPGSAAPLCPGCVHEGPQAHDPSSGCPGPAAREDGAPPSTSEPLTPLEEIAAALHAGTCPHNPQEETQPIDCFECLMAALDRAQKTPAPAPGAAPATRPNSSKNEGEPSAADPRDRDAGDRPAHMKPEGES